MFSKFLRQFKAGLSACFFMLIFFSCVPEIPKEFEPPVWETSFEFALIQTNIVLTEFVDEFSTNGGIYGYEMEQGLSIPMDSMKDSLKIDSIPGISFEQPMDIGIDPITTSISKNIGTFDIGSIPATETAVYLNELIGTGYSGGGVLFPGLTNCTNSFIMSNDAFTSATFSNGTITIAVTNDFNNITITKITLTFPPSAGLDPFVFSNIGAGSGETKSQSLSGVTFLNTNDVDVSADLSSGNISDVSTENVKFYTAINSPEILEAEAEIKPITNSNSASISLPSTGNNITSATISNGFLSLILTNNTSLSGDLFLEITSITNTSGNPFSDTIHFTATNVTNYETNLKEYVIAPEGGTNVSYTYIVTTEDTSPDPKTVNVNDKIDIKLALDGTQGSSDGPIKFSSVTGSFDQSITIEQSIPVSNDFAVIEEATFKSGSIDIGISNAPSGNSIVFIIEELKKDGSSFSNKIDLDGNDTNISYNLSNYALTLTADAQEVNYKAYTIFSGSVSTINPGAPINVSVGMNSLGFSDFTGSLSEEISQSIDPTVMDLGEMLGEMAGDYMDTLKGITVSELDLVLEITNSDITLPVNFALDVVISNSNESASNTLGTNAVFNDILVNGINLENWQNIELRDYISFGGDITIPAGESGFVNMNPIGMKMNIHVPFSISIDKDFTLTNVMEMDAIDALPELIKSGNITTVIDNGFSLGASVEVNIATNKNYFTNSSKSDQVASLGTITLGSKATKTSSVNATSKILGMIKHDFHLQIIATLKSESDIELKTDESLDVHISGGVTVEVNKDKFDF